LSPQPRHILDDNADLGSRGGVDEIYNGRSLPAHGIGNVWQIVREFEQFDLHLVERNNRPANEFADQSWEC
jgi:hypothetical protein